MAKLYIALLVVLYLLVARAMADESRAYGELTSGVCYTSTLCDDGHIIWCSAQAPCEWVSIPGKMVYCRTPYEEAFRPCQSYCRLP